jgi:hypothetical protein
MIKIKNEDVLLVGMVQHLKVAQHYAKYIHGSGGVEQSSKHLLGKEITKIDNFISELQDGLTERQRFDFHKTFIEDDFQSYTEIMRMISDMTSHQRNEVENYCTKLKQRKLIEINT